MVKVGQHRLARLRQGAKRSLTVRMIAAARHALHQHHQQARRLFIASVLGAFLLFTILCARALGPRGLVVRSGVLVLVVVVVMWLTRERLSQRARSGS